MKKKVFLMKHLFLAKFYQFLYFATDLRFRKDQIEFGDIKALQQFGFGKIWKYILGILPFYLREFGEVTAELWTKLKTLTFPGLLNLQHRCWNMMTINIELACGFGFLQPNRHMLVLMLNLTQYFLILFLPFKLRMFFGNAP